MKSDEKMEIFQGCTRKKRRDIRGSKVVKQTIRRDGEGAEMR